MDYTPQGLEVFHTLFKRGCLSCPDTVPTCPQCPPNHSCVQVSRTCDTCASRQCVLTADAAAPAPAPPSNPTNVGAIVGGVIGGVIAIALATYLIWRFFIKPRRAQYEDEYPEEYSDDKEGYENGYRPTAQAHRSGHSVRSIASTAMTRASNVIQIAFIPGITDRSGSDCPNSAIPPVPPVPLELADTQPATPYSARQIPPSPYTDTASTDHYFMPHDLRQSRFSEFSDESDGRSTRHYSIASSLARASFASGVYGQNATVSPPVQTAVGGKANVVSVSSSARATPGGTIPEVPSVDYIKYGQQQAALAKAASNNSSTTTVSTKEMLGGVKTVDVGAARQPANIMSAKSSATLLGEATPPATQHAQAHTSTVPPLPTNIANTNAGAGAAAAGTASTASSSSDLAKKAEKAEKKHRRGSSQHLAAAIADATRRASRQPTHGGLGSVPVSSREAAARDPSPFSDENAVVPEEEEEGGKR